LGQYSAASNAFSAQNGASAITVNITSGNNSLSGIAAAINSASNGAVNASVVGDGSGNSRLVLTSANTGAANGFSVAATGSLGALAYDPTGNTPSGMTQTQSATDASFSINGLALTSSTNSVSSAIAGVTLNLTQGPAAGGSPLQSQVTIGTDTSAIDSNINNFVSAYNAFVTQAGSLTNYNASTKTASELTGDPTTNAIVHSMQTILGGSTSGGSGALSYLAQVGITFTSAGTLSVNTTTLNAAIQSNPTGVANLFGGLAGSTSGQGLALQVSNMAQQMLDSGGMLGVTEQGLNSQLTYLKTRATMMQQNLTQTQNALLQEYSALNAAVTAGQAQQVQIANEMANLPG
jgi:flagellar hook-associated protein 2